MCIGVKRLSVGEGLYYELGWEQETKYGGEHKQKKRELFYVILIFVPLKIREKNINIYIYI